LSIGWALVGQLARRLAGQRDGQNCIDRCIAGKEVAVSEQHLGRRSLAA
jgi:hypothetical protein